MCKMELTPARKCISAFHFSLLVASVHVNIFRYTLTTMPPGAAYAGAFFRAFLAVKGGLVATFYSAATNPNTASLDSSSYVKEQTRIVHHGSDAFTCSGGCYAGARFHGFFKASGVCPDFVVASATSRTYVRGKIEVNGWSAAAGSTITVSNCANGQYVEIFQESRAGTSSSHAMNTLLHLDTSALATGNLFAAIAISNTPVPLTVTQA